MKRRCRSVDESTCRGEVGANYARFHGSFVSVRTVLHRSLSRPANAAPLIGLLHGTSESPVDAHNRHPLVLLFVFVNSLGPVFTPGDFKFVDDAL